MKHLLPILLVTRILVLEPFDCSPRYETSQPILRSQGSCPTPTIVNNFELNKFLGRWFEIERFFAPFQFGDCVTADYSLFPNSTVSVVNSNVVIGLLISIFGSAVSGPDPSKGELIVNFSEMPGANLFMSSEPNYRVVKTDYTNYAVIYSCRNITPYIKFEFSWILGRQERLDPDLVIQLKQFMKQFGIRVEKYMPTNQENCRRRTIY